MKNWFMPPLLPSFASSEQMHNIAETSYNAWLQDHGQSVAGLLLLSIENGLVSDNDIACALNHQFPTTTIHQLSLYCLDEVTEWLGKHALQEIPEDLGFNPFLELSIAAGDVPSITFTPASFWDVECDLTQFPTLVASAIFRTLDLIATHLTIGSTGPDFVESDYQLHESIDELGNYTTPDGAIDTDAIKSDMENDDGSYLDWYLRRSMEIGAYNDVDEVIEYLIKHTSLTPDWYKDARKRKKVSDPVLEARSLKWHISSWKRCAHDYFHSSIHEFIQDTCNLVIEHSAHFKAERGWDSDADNGFIGHAQAIYVGFPHEDLSISAARYGIMETGESLESRLVIDSLAPRRTCDTLFLFAKGSGLLQRFEAICNRYRSEDAGIIRVRL